jgi:hypothetical protein
MNDHNLLVVAIVVFTLMSIGLGLTIKEFYKITDEQED